MKKMKWKTKDGTEIPIKNLLDSHLINCIKFMRRHADSIRLNDIEIAFSILSTLQGEMAQDAVEEVIAFLTDMDEEEYLETNPLYKALLREAKKRKLEVV